MKRRSFLGLLAFAPLAPFVAKKAVAENQLLQMQQLTTQLTPRVTWGIRTDGYLVGSDFWVRPQDMVIMRKDIDSTCSRIKRQFLKELQRA